MVERRETLFPFVEGGGTTQVQFFAGNDRVPVLSFIHSYEGVTVNGNEPSSGASPVAGREKLKALRDGAIEACKHFGIE